MISIFQQVQHFGETLTIFKLCNIKTSTYCNNFVIYNKFNNYVSYLYEYTYGNAVVIFFSSSNYLLV